MSTLQQDRPAKLGAAIITLIVHAVLFFILMYILLTRPDPPLSGGEGMVVNLGYVDESTGEIQPMSENTMTDETYPEMRQPEQVEQTETVLTQDDEETEKIEIKEDKKEKVKVEQPVPAPNPVEEPPKEVKKEKVADPKSLYKGKSNNSTSQGNSTQGTGDQGDPKGDPNSRYYGKSGTGNSPGSGTGSGPGNGSGPGGISFDLKDRRPQRLPEPEYNVQEEGRVVVEITVDRNGNVIHAKAGMKGSTTTNTYLLDKARLAALSARFDANQNAPEFQKGYITYNFLLK